MITAGILTITTAVLPLLMGSPIRDCQFGRMGDSVAEELAVVNFERAVGDYASLHRRLERAWPPPLGFISEPEQAEFIAEEFRRALRDARPQATQGNLFTPEVAAVLRFRLSNALREATFDVAAMAGGTEEGESVDWWLFEKLPPLPLELEYRFVGRDLVVLDLRANMVVDVLDFALRSRSYASLVGDVRHHSSKRGCLSGFKPELALY